MGGEEGAGPDGDDDADSPPSAIMLANRLRKRARHLRRWAARESITCFRLYDRDIPEVPLAVDRYEDRLVVTVYAPRGRDASAADAETLAAWLRAARETLDVPAESVFVKTRRRRAPSEQHERLDTTGERVVVHEGGYRFLVNLADYVDTGLFLDHRQTRALVAKESGGRRVLNLFSYTGAFTVYAAGGGARSTTSVDMSNTYLAWARDNLLENGFDAPDTHRLVRDDVVAWLVHARRRGERYDLAILDPPTWSRGKKMEGSLDIQRDHVSLIRNTRALLDPGGVLWFSTNLSSFRLDPAAFEGAAVSEVTGRTVPPDYARSKPHKAWRSVEP